MADRSATPSEINTTAVIISTSIVTFITGFLVGIYSIRGYLISPALRAERAANLRDPIESDESEIDEDDTILDHAPNWANGLDADRKQGLRVKEEESSAKKSKKKGGKKGALEESLPKAGEAKEGNPNEECKLVLVVRTDLGMTKGEFFFFPCRRTIEPEHTTMQPKTNNVPLFSQILQAKSPPSAPTPH